MTEEIRRNFNDSQGNIKKIEGHIRYVAIIYDFDYTIYNQFILIN